jgi:hypothetical protein
MIDCFGQRPHQILSGSLLGTLALGSYDFAIDPPSILSSMKLPLRVFRRCSATEDILETVCTKFLGFLTHKPRMACVTAQAQVRLRELSRTGRYDETSFEKVVG